MASDRPPTLEEHQPNGRSEDQVRAQPTEDALRGEERNRGRKAGRPADIPAKGWWDIAVRVGKDLSRDNVSLIAAGLALWGLLAVFPGLTATVSVYGLFADPASSFATSVALLGRCHRESGSCCSRSCKTWPAMNAVP